MVRNREPGSDLLVADVGGMGIMACRRLGQSTRAQWIIAANRRRSRLLCSCPCGQLKSDAVASKLALLWQNFAEDGKWDSRIFSMIHGWSAVGGAGQWWNRCRLGSASQWSL